MKLKDLQANSPDIPVHRDFGNGLAIVGSVELGGFEVVHDGVHLISGDNEFSDRVFGYAELFAQLPVDWHQPLAAMPSTHRQMIAFLVNAYKEGYLPSEISLTMP